MKGINAMDKSIAPKGRIIHGLGSMVPAEMDAASVGTRECQPKGSRDSRSIGLECGFIAAAPARFTFWVPVVTDRRYNRGT
jgi:hypothetical protein